MKRLMKAVVVVALVAGLMGGIGCIRRVPREQSDRVNDHEQSVRLNGATALEADISMAAGELTIIGGDIAPDALRGDFEYSPDRFRPEITSNSEGAMTRVAVDQPEATGLDLSGGDVHSSWDVTLPSTVPTALTVRLGAGEGDIDLRGMNISEFELEQGAGEATIDLSKQSAALTARATIGAGEVTIKLPAGTGVRVRGHKDGIGEWSYPGFRVEGDYLVNDAFGKPGTETIDFDVQRAVGRVSLIEVQ